MGQIWDSIYYAFKQKKKKLCLTPDTCPEGEFVFEQSSELDEEVDVGVIVTELLLPAIQKNPPNEKKVLLKIVQL